MSHGKVFLEHFPEQDATLRIKLAAKVFQENQKLFFVACQKVHMESLFQDEPNFFKSVYLKQT